MALDFNKKCWRFILQRYVNQKFIKKIIGIILVLFLGRHIVVLRYGIYNYSHVPSHSIDSLLYKQAISAVLTKDRLNCTYEAVLQNTHSVWNVPKNYDDFEARDIANGAFSPAYCNPLFSVAILVPYRNRQEHLKIFLPYMHNFLRKQYIHYKIYIIEQQDNRPFNRGLLFNLGARAAVADGFPCLILHDVDLLPLDDSNLYACAIEPRHLSASIDRLRFVLPYEELVGGVLAVRSDQFLQVNGFSNRFWSWGGEDDDLFMRMDQQEMKVIRFPRSMSRYTMLRHARTMPNAVAHAQMLANARETIAERRRDGLRTVRAHVRTVQQRLFTLLVAQA